MEGEVVAYKIEWQRRYRRTFRDVKGFSTSADYATGKQREAILDRDNYKCVECGMSDVEHKVKWSRPITIDHRDKNRKNNDPSNLQTLCLACHGRKDLLPRLRQSKAEPHKDQILQLRSEGKTYRQIADELSLSIATPFKWIKIWEGQNG